LSAALDPVCGRILGESALSPALTLSVAVFRVSALSAADPVCHGFRLRCRMRSIDDPDGGQDLHSSALGAKVMHPRKSLDQRILAAYRRPVFAWHPGGTNL